MLRYVFVVMLFVFTVSNSHGLEVGDSTLRTPITSGDKEIKFADFHGKSNLIVVGDVAGHPEFSSQLEQKTGAIEAKYDVTVLRLQVALNPDPIGEKGEILIIDKSGYVRWKFPGANDSAQPTIKQLESELAKLKRDSPLSIGSPAPDFQLVDVESGILFSLSDYKGKKHVLLTLLLQTY